MSRHLLSSRRLLTGALVGLALSPMTAFAQNADWKPVPGKIMSRWAKEVDPKAPWPEYPRPTMVREKWQNLNGLWDYAISDANTKPASWDGKILVPYPVESSLSGVGKRLMPTQTLHYRRMFSVPGDWKDQRVVLHFGAADWHASVSVNGKSVGEHKGGFAPFSFDITDALKAGDNEITVAVKDATDQSGQPRGKQWLEPHAIWYTPTSGIWQTVWMEPVPQVHIESIRCETNRTDGTVTFTPTVAGADKNVQVEFNVTIDGTNHVRVKGPANERITLRLPQIRAWTPDDPFLYPYAAYIVDRAKDLSDPVSGYFAMRDVKVAKDDAGVNRLMLNGKPVFHFGPLDQGFWPDGLYTPPNEAAMKFDIDAAKMMGCNMLRKHVKVESERFYFLCDKLGIMVWQDMPSPFFHTGDGENKYKNPAPTDEWKANFEREWREIMTDFGSHPSIVMWVPFNEGWGQNNLEWAKSMVLKTKEWDPSRLVNNASGWTDMKVGDVNDIHAYPAPATPPKEDKRAAVLGEYGGLGLPVDGHTWVNKDNWGYISFKNKDELTEAYVDMLRQIPVLIGQGLSAAVYTQTTDVEIETNGWLTYDREVWKIEPSRVIEATKALYLPPPNMKVLLPHAGDGTPGTWQYSTSLAPDSLAWTKPGDATAADKWKQGQAGFGTNGTPGAIVKTEWNTPDIWIRRSFTLPAGALANPSLSIHHDEDAKVYINGELAADLKGYKGAYSLVPLSSKAAKLLKPGENFIAIHCHQTRGGQYLDCGIVDVIPGEAKKTGAEPSKKTSRRENIEDYETRTLAGFTLKINREFAKNDAPLLDRVLVQLSADLDEMTHFVPPGAAETLRSVTIWIERQGSTAMGWGGHGMCCHWSPAWLDSNGLLVEKAGGVEIINPTDFLAWRRDQPYMTFHEFSHAYHWRLAKLDGEIGAAFEKARAAGIYDQVERNTLTEGKTERAYAISNSHEYFAELSEAYFALNDFYPYTRRQLAQHDSDGLRMIERLWNLSLAEISENTSVREATKESSPAAAR